jgi:acyl-CoA thioester hydrolase
VFTVRSLQIEYLAPAAMDDLLEVETRVSRVRGASLEFHQRIVRECHELVTATVLVAAIRGDRPTRLPETLRREIDRRLHSGDEAIQGSR